MTGEARVLKTKLATITLLAVALAACGGGTASTLPGSAAPSTQPTAGSSHQASPPSSAQPSAAPPSAAPPATPPAIGTFDVFPPGAAVQVAVKDLNLRTNPSMSAKRLDTLGRGDVLVVSLASDANFTVGFGPVLADGYSWYPVIVTSLKDGALPTLPAPVIERSSGPTWGWVASDDGETQYLTSIAPRCPGTIDLRNIQGMLAAERLACFDGPIVLEGTFGGRCCSSPIAGTYEPDWMATAIEWDFLTINPSQVLGPLALRFAPDGPSRPPAGSIIRVTVHVDDPRSATCQMTWVSEDGALTLTVDSRTAALYCRERLVVESYEVLGADARW